MSSDTYNQTETTYKLKFALVPYPGYFGSEVERTNFQGSIHESIPESLEMPLGFLQTNQLNYIYNGVPLYNCMHKPYGRGETV